MNSSNIDSQFCGSLPIQDINTIQPHGAILLISMTDMKVIQVSDNIERFIGIDAKRLIQTDHLDHVPGDPIEINALLKPSQNGQIPHPLMINGHDVQVLVHSHELYYILDIESDPISLDAGSSGLHRVRELISVLEFADPISTVCDLALQELQKITGFDGMMMYRFDPD